MHSDLLFPSLYLKTGDLRGKDVTLTIAGVELEDLMRPGGKSEQKPIVYFEETAASAKRSGRDEKRLVLNKTNARTIIDLYGTETDEWTGKRITLFPTTATFGRQTVDAMRIRDRVPSGKGNQPPPDDEPEPGPDDLDGDGIPFGHDDDGVVC